MCNSIAGRVLRNRRGMIQGIEQTLHAPTHTHTSPILVKAVKHLGAELYFFMIWKRNMDNLRARATCLHCAVLPPFVLQTCLYNKYYHTRLYIYKYSQWMSRHTHCLPFSHKLYSKSFFSFLFFNDKRRSRLI